MRFRPVILALLAAAAPLAAEEDDVMFADYFDWAESHGLVGVFGAPDADLDGDGITNLMAYAFGLDLLTGPEIWDLLPELAFLGDPPEPVLMFILPRRPPMDISYVVECFTDSGRRAVIARKTGKLPWVGSGRIFTRLLEDGRSEVTILPPLEADVLPEGKPLRLRVEFAP